jgi:anti-sigma B factor antagonist
MQTTTGCDQQVAVSGRVNAQSAARVRGRLHAAVRSGAGPLVIDMSQVESLDAVGLGVLMGTHRLAVEHGRTVVLRGCPPRITRLLRAIRLHRVLQLDDAPAAAA